MVKIGKSDWFELLMVSIESEVSVVMDVFNKDYLGVQLCQIWDIF